MLDKLIIRSSSISELDSLEGFEIEDGLFSEMRPPNRSASEFGLVTAAMRPPNRSSAMRPPNRSSVMRPPNRSRTFVS